MMNIFISIFTGVIFLFLYYLLICLLNIKFDLQIKTDKYLIKDFGTWAIGVVGFIATGVITFLRFDEMSLYQFILFLIIDIAVAAIAISDIKKQFVPNPVIVSLMAVWVVIIFVAIIFEGGNGISLAGQGVLGAILAGVVFLLCYLISRHQLGAGDVKMAFVMGLYITSVRIIGSIFYGTVICALFSIVQLIRKKVDLKSGIPMVPFLYLGILTAYIIM